MILLAVAGIAILLVPLWSTGWACVSDDQGFRLPPNVGLFLTNSSTESLS
jgi:hypothetical protein